MEAPIDLNTNWGLLGHEWAVGLLRRQIADGRQRHAYLFTGPLGVGRRSLALRLAQALNCTQSPAPGEMCGECRACRGFGRAQHPDLLLVERQEGDREIKIDALRALSRSLSRTPLEARYQIALILNFHYASEEAANALLKTLEEPNPSVILCLTAVDADSIPATVVSRCELVRLRPQQPSELAAALQSRLGVAALQAQLLAAVSQGLPGLAVRMHQDGTLLENRANCLEMLASLLGASRVERFIFAEKASKDRQALRDMLLVWLSYWRDVVMAASGGVVALNNIDRRIEIYAIAQMIGFDRAAQVLQAVEKTVAQLESNVNARLALEVLLLELPVVAL
ncbi:MAG TPA: DNA polymerase III subunit delta' C-terminal domain-containing protein [Anaerolineales bacterium]|nr:DNA polymerase III subunit delta' C-terminal domain-containing protein [Anaerolineales bacterium]HRQ92442.1 DNA polymerase III subunit delta' C-terminal domain-containing protein [Anaerolineales bacterium]